MTRRERIADALSRALAPSHLDVEDESARHHGHAGARPEGETHFRVSIVSERFSGLNRVARHRLVNQALRPEFDAGLHALAVDARAPGEP